MQLVARQTELAVRIQNTPAALGQLMAVAAERGIKLLACCSYAERESTMALLVADDPVRLTRALNEAGFQCKPGTVVTLGPHRDPGWAAWAGGELARAGIAVIYSYASWDAENLGWVVMRTSDDDRAITILKCRALIREAAAIVSVAKAVTPAACNVAA